LEQARREGRVVYEGWELRRDGSSFFAHSILTRMNDTGGRLLGYTKVTRDITSQKQAEHEQTKLQSILNTVVDPLLVIDGDGLIETFNPAAERVFGYEASEVMHRNVSLLMPSPVREEHDGYLSRYRETREARVIGIGRDIHAQRKDGEVFPAELSVSEMWVQGRQKFTGIVRDISARKAAEEALQRSERRLYLALEAGNIGVWDMDVETEVVIATGPLFEPLIVPEDNAADLTGWISLNHPDDQAVMREQFDQIVRGDRELMELEHRLQTRTGGWYWLFTRASVSRVDENGKALSMHGVTVDIHQRRVTEEALRKSKLDMEMAIRDADFHLWHLDVTTCCLTDLDELLETLGYAEAADTHSVEFWRSLLHPDDLAHWSRQAVLPLPEELQDDGVELRLRTKDGSWRWLITRARVTETDARGQPLIIAGTCIDITSRKRSAEQLLHAAQHDSLTGLPNRALTYALGEHLLESAPRHGQRSAVLFVDLDRFKPINDHYGHATGDAVLQEVANRLKKCVRTEDVVGRLGGDEFVVILAQVGKVNDISKVAAKCLAEISRPILHKDLELAVSPSIGISLFPADGGDMDALVKHADIAMYHAKQNGRNQFRFFTSAMNKQAKSLLKFEARMRRAIDRQ
ncbi:MAG: PAS domain S-box protein, partial [Wenzhouxiangella sp.]